MNLCRIGAINEANHKLLVALAMILADIQQEFRADMIDATELLTEAVQSESVHKAILDRITRYMAE